MFLEEIVKEEMIAEGFNPLNKEDIIRFWKTKGFEL